MFQTPTVPHERRNLKVENSEGHSLPNGLAPPLPSLDLRDSEKISENREESQIAEPLCTSGTTLIFIFVRVLQHIHSHTHE